MSPEDSVSHWIASLKDGEAEAAQKLWDRYANDLLDLASKRLATIPKRAADEDDIANSVFFSICRGAKAGRFEAVQDRSELWWLLIAITKQKVVDYVRRESAEKRGGGKVRTEADLAGAVGQANAALFDELVADAPTPEFLVSLEEQHQRLLGLLRNDQLRFIANARIEGYSVGEIAEVHRVSTRTIERKLSLIRDRWAGELNGAKPSNDFA